MSLPRVVRGQRASPPPLTHDIDNGSRVVIDRCGDRYGRWAAFGEYIHPSLVRQQSPTPRQVYADQAVSIVRKKSAATMRVQDRMRRR